MITISKVLLKKKAGSFTTNETEFTHKHGNDNGEYKGKTEDIATDEVDE